MVTSFLYLLNLKVAYLNATICTPIKFLSPEYCFCTCKFKKIISRRFVNILRDSFFKGGKLSKGY